MALALNNLQRLIMPLNKEAKPNQIQWIAFMPWTASVMWYTCYKLACTEILQHFWLALVIIFILPWNLYWVLLNSKHLHCQLGYCEYIYIYLFIYLFFFFSSIKLSFSKICFRARYRPVNSTGNSDRFVEEYQSHRHKLTTAYLYHLAGQVQDLDFVALDHCYAKPWSAHPDASNAKPLRMLFMHKFPRNGDAEENSV